MHETHEDTTASNGHVDQVELVEFTEEEAHTLFEEVAQRNLGISGDEFRERWHRGDYDDDPDRPEVMTVAMNLPLVERRKSNR